MPRRSSRAPLSDPPGIRKCASASSLNSPSQRWKLCVEVVLPALVAVGSSAATAGRASDSARPTARSLCTGNLQFDITKYTDPQPEIESQIRDGTGALRYSMLRGRRKENLALPTIDHWEHRNKTWSNSPSRASIANRRRAHWGDIDNDAADEPQSHGHGDRRNESRGAQRGVPPCASRKAWYSASLRGP
jgi:hypothetical protein